MGVLTVETRDEHRALVARVMSRFPTYSVLALQEKLKETGLPLSYNYLYKIVKDVKIQRVRDMNEQTKEDLFAEIQAVVSMVNEQLLIIANEEKLVYTKVTDQGKPTEKVETRIYGQQNRIKAMNSMVDNLMKLTQLKMDLGIVDRKLGTADLRFIDMMAALKNIRNGDYTKPIRDLIPSGPIIDVGGGDDDGEGTA